MEEPGASVLAERMTKVHRAIEQGISRAASEVPGTRSTGANHDDKVGELPLSEVDANRLRRSSEEATRAAQQDLDGSLSGMYRAVERLTAFPWDPSEEREIAVQRADDVLRTWGAGGLEAMIEAKHQGESTQDIARSVTQVRDRALSHDAAKATERPASVTPLSERVASARASQPVEQSGRAMTDRKWATASEAPPGRTPEVGPQGIAQQL